MKQLIDDFIQDGKFDLTQVFADKSRSDLIRGLAYCTVRHGFLLQQILLATFELVQSITKNEWKQLVEIVCDEDPHYLQDFANFILIFSNVDTVYLSEIGFPEDVIIQLNDQANDPSFPYGGVPDGKDLKPVQMKLRNLKKQAIENAKLSSAQLERLEALFTSVE